MRAYIECSLDAALATKNHGFKFVSENNVPLIFNETYFSTKDCQHGVYAGERFYIHSQSFMFINAIIGDLIIINNGGDYPVYVHSITGEYIRWGFGGCNEAIPLRIIERNGRPFPRIKYEDK